MKHFFLMLALSGAFAVSAQIINGVDLWKDSTIQYIQLNGMQRFSVVNSKVIVDYGQKVAFGESTQVSDYTGTEMKFNSMIHVLNFFYAHNWVLVNTQVVNIDGTTRQFCILQKGKR